MDPPRKGEEGECSDDDLEFDCPVDQEESHARLSPRKFAEHTGSGKVPPPRPDLPLSATANPPPLGALVLKESAQRRK